MCDQCLTDKVYLGTDAFKARVETGVATLDEHYPGWWKDINLADLDLGSAFLCVLGQTARANGSEYLIELFKVTHGYRPPYSAETNCITVTGDQQDAMYHKQMACGFALDSQTPIGWDLATQIWREKIAELKATRNPVTNPTVLV